MGGISNTGTGCEGELGRLIVSKNTTDKWGA